MNYAITFVVLSVNRAVACGVMIDFTFTSVRQKAARLNVNAALCACTGNIRKNREDNKL